MSAYAPFIVILVLAATEQLFAVMLIVAAFQQQYAVERPSKMLNDTRARRCHLIYARKLSLHWDVVRYPPRCVSSCCCSDIKLAVQIIRLEVPDATTASLSTCRLTYAQTCMHCCTGPGEMQTFGSCVHKLRC